MEDLTFQEIHTYASLADQGIVPKIPCMFQEDHTVVSWPGEEDKVVLRCLDCRTNLIPGLELIQTFRKLLSWATKTYDIESLLKQDQL